MTRGITTVVKCVQIEAADVAIEGDPSSREMTVIRGDEDDELRAPAAVEGGCSEIKATKGRV